MNAAEHGHSRLRTAVAAVVATALIAGCANPGPDRAPIATLQPTALGLGAAPSPQVPERWWSAWEDPALDALMARALSGHPGIALARARVDRARALSELHRAQSAAQGSLSADLTRERYTEHGLAPAALAGRIRDTADLRAVLSWAPELDGRQAADLAAALGQARAAEADAALAGTGLAVQVARSYIALGRTLALRELARQTQVLREQVLVLVRQRVAAGLDGASELAWAESAMQEARLEGEQLDGQAGLVRRQLAVLAGMAPDALEALVPGQQRAPDLPQAAALGTDLLGRRPDVVAARWRVESALQEVELARLQFHPNLSLGAFIGLSSLGLSNLLRSGSLQAGLTPALRLPLFDGGRLRQQLGVRRADLDSAIAQYNGTLQEAVGEAVDALRLAEDLSVQRRLQEERLASARRSLALARQREAAGLGNRLAGLQAEVPVIDQLRQVAELKARQLDNQVLLVRALGGGWREGNTASAVEERKP